MLRFPYLALGIFMSVSVFSEEIDFDDYVHTPSSQCMEQFDMKRETLEEIVKAEEFNKIDPCFIACNLKEKSLMNEEGMIDFEQADKFVEKYVSDPALRDKIKQRGRICSAVNDMKLSDDKGCERAHLLMKCFHDHKE